MADATLTSWLVNEHMIELVVALGGATVSVLASMLTTGVRIGAEKQAREDLTARHSELSKETRTEIATLKADREHAREKVVNVEKELISVNQRLDAAQSQLATRMALENERMEHLRQQVESKASSEMVAGLKQQIERIDQKLDQLLASSPPAAARRRK